MKTKGTEDQEFASFSGSRARVLITGATGFVGANLTRKLVAAGLSVRALARESSRRDQFENLPVEWIIGDLCDPGLIKDAVKGVSYVFHMASTFRQARASNELHHKVHIEATKLLSRAAVDQAELKRFVHVSTIGVHGRFADVPANEECSFNPGDHYQRTKADAELWIRQFAQETNLPLTVVRPTSIYGPGDRRFLKLFKMVKSGFVPTIGAGEQLLHLVHVDDLTDCMMLLATHPQALGEVFICGGPEACRFRQMVAMIAESLAVKVRFICLPQKPVLLLAGICESICIPLGIPPPISKRRVSFFIGDRAFDTAKLHSRLGFEPSRSNASGLGDLARWYVNNGWLSG